MLPSLCCVCLDQTNLQTVQLPTQNVQAEVFVVTGHNKMFFPLYPILETKAQFTFYVWAIQNIWLWLEKTVILVKY